MEKKISLSLFIVLIVSVILIIFIFIYTFFNTIATKKIEINLSCLTPEEKSEFIKLNFLELTDYPSSIEFITLIEESQVRESQFKIIFSVNNSEKDLYNIERNNSFKAERSSIFKIKEEKDKTIYRFETNFTSNSKDSKWNNIYDIIKKYQKYTNSGSNIISEEHSKPFKLIFRNNNDLSIYEIIYDKSIFNNYSIKRFGGTVFVSFKNNTINLEKAITEKEITGEEIINKALFDSQNHICTCQKYENTNNIEFYYSDYTILIFNSLENKYDLVIGKPGSILGEYQEQIQKNITK